MNRRIVNNPVSPARPSGSANVKLESLSDDDLQKHILENRNVRARVIDNKHKKVMTRELSKGDHAGIVIENTSDKCYDVTFGFKL